MEPEDMLFNKQLLKQSVNVLSLRIPAKLTGDVIQALRGQYLYVRPHMKAVITDPSNEDYRQILLAENITQESIPSLPLSSDTLSSAQIIPHTIELSYDDLSLDEVLHKILPSDIVVPSSFEAIGHIAHLNLHDSQQPYKKIIGQVLIDKNPRIRTVVNKCQSISTVFRTFAMEVIAGEDNFEVEISESNCRFKFNYADVYWNSRLQTEHARLISKFSSSDIVCDMFAGVGPFSIPAAKNRKCKVYANDLNPKSYHWLKINSQLNKISNMIECFNMDGRDFVKQLINDSKLFSQVIMNLPASAETFLDVFSGYPDDLPHPIINCYVFSAANDKHKDVIQRVEFYLKRRISNPEIYDVRDVAPGKHMYCVSFRLPRSSELIIEKRKQDIEGDEKEQDIVKPEQKKMKCSK